MPISRVVSRVCPVDPDGQRRADLGAFTIPTPLSNVRPWGPGMLLSTEHPSLSASYVTGVFCAEQHARRFGEVGVDRDGGGWVGDGWGVFRGGWVVGVVGGVGVVRVGGGLGLVGGSWWLWGCLGGRGEFEVGGSIIGVGGWLSARFASRGGVAGCLGVEGS